VQYAVCLLLPIPGIEIQVPGVIEKLLPNLETLYKAFLQTVPSTSLADGAFLTILGSFTTTSLKEFYEQDKRTDEIMFAKDMLTQPPAFDFIVGMSNSSFVEISNLFK
jgi:hypothetical protein